MNWVLTHAVISFLAGGLPLLVVLVALASARRASAEAGCTFVLPRRSVGRLLVATCAVWAAFGVWLALDHQAVSAGEHRLLLGAVECVASLALFGLFGVSALNAIQSAALAEVRDRAATSDARLHAASLAPRRVSDYLSISARVIPPFACAGALVLLALRLLDAGPDVRLFMPIANAVIAFVFFVLYEVWLRQEAHGPQALGTGHERGPTPEDAERIRRWRVRAVFLIQVVLTLFFSIAAHATVGIRWESAGGGPLFVALAAASVVLGGIGCALALSSEISSRCLGLLVRQLR